MLKIRNFTKTYSGKTAVDELNLEVSPGDIYGFIGHNGAGKTTTIKSIVGILEFDSGDILVNGNSIKKDPIGCKKSIAYIPDAPFLYEYLTGIEYVNFICDMFEVPAKLAKSNLDKYVKLFEMEKVLNQKISTYSHGMKQKILIVAALIRNPKLFVLDEPFTGLDPKASFTLKEIMKELKNEGNAIFFSTHVLEVAEKLCNKIAIIRKGKLVVSGETHAVSKGKDLESVFMEAIRHE